MTGVEFIIKELELEYNSFPLLRAEDCIKAQEIEYDLLKKVWDKAIDVGWNLGNEQGESHISNISFEEFINNLKL